MYLCLDILHNFYLKKFDKVWNLFLNCPLNKKFSENWNDQFDNPESLVLSKPSVYVGCVKKTQDIAADKHKCLQTHFALTRSWSLRAEPCRYMTLCDHIGIRSARLTATSCSAGQRMMTWYSWKTTVTNRQNKWSLKTFLAFWIFSQNLLLQTSLSFFGQLEPNHGWKILWSPNIKSY